jgi:hypothetical protein
VNSERAAKDPSAGPVPNRSLANPDDLWQLIGSGYAVVKVSGAVLSEKPTPDFDADVPPDMAEMLSNIAAHTQSPEAKIIGEVLAKDYDISQTIPATSHPIGQLAVNVDISGPEEAGSRRVRATLNFSYRMEAKGGEGVTVMPRPAVDADDYAPFRAATRDAIAAAFEDLNQDRSAP